MSRRLFRGSLRSRPFPAFGRTPPFHCRFTGEKSASLAHPPGLWPFSPVSLPFHGGEVRFVRAPSRPLAVLPRSTAVPRGRSPFVRAPSRPLAVLPRFTAVSRGRSPFCSRPLPAFGRTPPFHCRFTGEKSASLAHPPGLWPFSPVRPPFHGGEVRFVRAPSRPSAVLPRFTAVPRGRSPFVRAPSRPLAL